MAEILTDPAALAKRIQRVGFNCGGLCIKPHGRMQCLPQLDHLPRG